MARIAPASFARIAELVCQPSGVWAVTGYVARLRRGRKAPHAGIESNAPFVMHVEGACRTIRISNVIRKRTVLPGRKEGKISGD